MPFPQVQPDDLRCWSYGLTIHRTAERVALRQLDRRQTEIDACFLVTNGARTWPWATRHWTLS
jgi:hypothetical protein